MDKPTRMERFRYWFDGWMSRGTVALMALLGIATLVFVVLLGAITVLVLTLIRDRDNLNPGDAGSIWDIFWGSLMRTLDPGTMGGDQGWFFRILMLIVTIGGLIIVASLIGIVSGAFDSKVEELRKGRSRVLEQDHTLILGWSPKVFQIVSELVIANESRKRAVIVILADRDKVEMEDALRAKIPDQKNTKLVCRSGDPMDLVDLDLVNPHGARSIIVLAPEGSDDPDIDVIKTTLAITNNPRRKAGKYHVVGEIRDAANMETAQLVGKDEASWVLGTDLISRITVQTCRQSGLSLVYTELLDFDGDEIYFSEQPSLVGRSYAEAQLQFADCSVIGLQHRGAVTVNPAASTVLEAGDELILIAEDDSVIRLGQPGTADRAKIDLSPVPTGGPERTLVLGVNLRLRTMLTELDEYIAKGSEAVVVADRKAPDLPGFDNLSLRFQRGDTTSRSVLEALNPSSFDHIIVLADKDGDPQRSDARTLVTLLNLREIAAKTERPSSVVSEMLDDRNRELAEVTQADDFIVSDRLISLMLSQLSESQKLKAVFDELFNSEGSEVYLRPLGEYVRLDEPVDFYTVVAAASERGETAIGYRIAAQARIAGHGYGVVVNPPKADAQTYTAGDKVIVLGDG
jgi:voltage-gated potassium channel Kch